MSDASVPTEIQQISPYRTHLTRVQDDGAEQDSGSGAEVGLCIWYDMVANATFFPSLTLQHLGGWGVPLHFGLVWGFPRTQELFHLTHLFPFRPEKLYQPFTSSLRFVFIFGQPLNHCSVGSSHFSYFSSHFCFSFQIESLNFRVFHSIFCFRRPHIPVGTLPA